MTQGFTSSTPFQKTITGKTAPQFIPYFVGQEYINTTTGAIYKAVGTKGIYNWGMIGKGEVSSFTKDTVPNIFAWWKADHGVTKNGGNLVSAWTDYVNGWAIINSGGTDMPLWEENKYNNQPGITFDGSNDYLSLNTSDTGNSWTFFTIFSINTTYTDLRILVDHGGGNSRIDVARNPSQICIGDYSYVVGMGTYSLNRQYLVVARSQGTNLYGRLNNGVETLVKSSYSTALAAMRFGQYWGGGYFCNGTVCEHLIYNASLTEENIQKVMIYLNNKYAIY